MPGGGHPFGGRVHRCLRATFAGRGSRTELPNGLQRLWNTSSAQAYSLNLTAVTSSPLDYLTAWPTGQLLPVAATLNDVSGVVVGNAAIVPAGTSGAINVFASNNTNWSSTSTATSVLSSKRQTIGSAAKTRQSSQWAESHQRSRICFESHAPPFCSW